jgi:hypothetical protein
MYGLPSNTNLSFLKGRELLQLCIGRHQVQLRFDGDVTISLEGEFTLDGQRHAVGDGHRLHVLLGLGIETTRPEGRGDIVLSFDQHTLVLHDSKASYESYELRGPGIDIVV